MQALISKIKPASGFAYLLHLGLLILLPAAVFILVRIQFVQLAFSVILLSKWRMLAVRPRFWPAIIRANAVDLMVGLSIVIFMTHSGSMLWQLIWAALYAVWLIVIKPSSSTLMVSFQAGIGQLCALMALMVAWASGSLAWLVFATGLICYLAARHFFDSYEEGYAKMLSYLWGYFGAALMWVLGHWLLYYGPVAQPTLLLSVLGYGLATLYALDHHDRLTNMLRRQLVFIMIAVVVVVLIFSDWGSKVV